MDFGQASILSIFLSMLNNTDDENLVLAQVRGRLNLSEVYACDVDGLNDDIELRVPAEVSPGTLGVSTMGVYKCRDKKFTILVIVQELAVAPSEGSAGAGLSIDDNVTLQCEVSVENGAGRMSSNVNISDSLEELKTAPDSGGSIDRDLKEEVLTLLANRSGASIGPSLFYCTWNVRVQDEDAQTLRNFAVLVSIHVKSFGSTVEPGEEEDYDGLRSFTISYKGKEKVVGGATAVIGSFHLSVVPILVKAIV